MALSLLTCSLPIALDYCFSCHFTENWLFKGTHIHVLFCSQQIPKWWIWFYYLIPTSWTLNGMFTSQYGDIEKEIMVFGESKTVSAFLKDYFGFHHNRLPIVAVMLILYPFLFASIFAYCIGKLNFQKR